jgi:hypothetical protein
MLAHILDELNAWGALEEAKEARLRRTLCFGPKALGGPKALARPSVATAEGWAGVMLWCRPRTYYSYKTLYLLGVWVYGENSIFVGVKTLAYSAPYFNVESYMRQTQSDFRIYYPDDGRPPMDKPILAHYDPAQRLQLRRDVQRELMTQAEALASQFA